MNGVEVTDAFGRLPRLVHGAFDGVRDDELMHRRPEASVTRPPAWPTWRAR